MVLKIHYKCFEFLIHQYFSAYDDGRGEIVQTAQKTCLDGGYLVDISAAMITLH